MQQKIKTNDILKLEELYCVEKNNKEYGHIVMYMYISNDKLVASSGGKVVVRDNVKDKLKRIQEKDRFMVLRPTQIR